MRYFIEHAYDGTAYKGWQIQHNGITVQQVLQDKLAILLKQKIRLIGSSRTDTGVHALQQFAHFDLDFPIPDPERLTFQLNAILPHDIAVAGIYPVEEQTHSRFAATHRRYCYKLARKKNPFLFNKAYYYHRPLDLERMNEAAALLFQHLDFESFSKIHTDVNNFNCTITLAEWVVVDDKLWEFHVQSNRFLRGMVRALVGTFLEVGEGKRSVEAFEDLILARDRKKAGPQAPPHGLYLVEVGYPTEIFRYKSE